MKRQQLNIFWHVCIEDTIIRDKVEYASKVITDTAGIYSNLNEEYFHHTVNHALNEYVRDEFHTNL